MDFGIAHSLETPGMTRTGALTDTPEYMSPEQARGMKADALSDFFALGIIFCELLTGTLDASTVVGYEADFNFGPASYMYFYFGASSVAIHDLNTDQELSGVAALP